MKSANQATSNKQAPAAAPTHSSSKPSTMPKKSQAHPPIALSAEHESNQNTTHQSKNTASPSSSTSFNDPTAQAQYPTHASTHKSKSSTKISKPWQAASDHQAPTHKSSSTSQSLIQRETQPPRSPEAQTTPGTTTAAPTTTPSHGTSGNLGYVPSLPQGGIAGSNSDRVVILHSTFGRNAPLNPFHLGRTVTHEVGHYLGLEHTFSGGCSNGYTSGDLISDTNPESSPTYGCPGSRTSCGSAAPIHNYMDYSDDICMNQFTPEQSNRMRCSLINYRPDLYELAAGPCSPADLVQPYGSLNFLDVSSFIVQFGNQDPAADLNDDGSHNFLDVSQYLSIYGDGCP